MTELKSEAISQDFVPLDDEWIERECLKHNIGVVYIDGEPVVLNNTVLAYFGGNQ